MRRPLCIVPRGATGTRARCGCGCRVSIQLGQASVNPPDLCLKCFKFKSGGFTLDSPSCRHSTFPAGAVITFAPKIMFPGPASTAPHWPHYLHTAVTR